MRRCLLEKVTLTINTAFEKARALDQKNSEAYVSTETSAWSTASGNTSEQARNQLGTPAGDEVFWEGPKFFKLIQ